jgi:hypothetical protein
MFANTTAYTTRHLMDFVVEHIYDTSLVLPEGEDIRNHIKLPDLQLLIWGLACAIYPTGFQYRRACIADPEKCRHLVEEKLNLSRMLWTDFTKFTERQISHMTKRARGSVTLEQIKIYQDDFLIGKDVRVQLDEDLFFTLTMPSVQAHIEAGYRWSGTIEDTYGRSLAYDEAARRDFLSNQAKATVMREYAHCVKSIETAGDVFDDLNIVENALNDMSSRPDLREKFTTAVRKFLDASYVSFIGIPTYKCPGCGKEQTEDKSGNAYPEIIPLDVVQTFFSLTYQRTQNIERRDLRVAGQ